MKSNKVLLSIIGIAILVVALSGVTLAFFNYTRTGSSNNFNVGRIYFNTSQDGNINLTNVFPIASDDLGTDTDNHDSVTINIEGDTTYSEGVEYLITFEQVNNQINNKRIPISFTVTSEDLGEASNDYYNERGSDESVYLLMETGQVNLDGKYIVVGYIAPGQSGIDGSITISAYLDKDKIAISDTYPEETIRTVIITEYSSSTCETILDGVENASTYCLSAESLQEAIDNEDLTDAQITLLVNAGIIEEYTDGTTSEWLNGRTVFTTEEWNNFQNNGVSFKVRVEANEGIWVEPETTPDSCFTFSPANKYYIVNPNMTTSELNTCVSYFEELVDIENNPLQEGETLENYCNGTGIIVGESFQQGLDHNGFNLEQLTYLEEHNIIDGIYTVGIRDYDASCGSDVVIPSKIEVEYKTYTVNSNMTTEELNTCVSYFEEGLDIENNPLLIGETLESFCDGTGTAYGHTFQQILDDEREFNDEQLEYLEEHNIINSQTQNVTSNNIILEFESFALKGLTSVVIPNSVKKIFTGAFSDNQLTSVTIGSGVTTIDTFAFYGNHITNMSIDMVNISDYFASNQGLSELTNLSLGEHVTTIGYHAFYDNQLTSVTVPDSVVDAPWYYNDYECKYFDGGVNVTWNNETHECTGSR